VFDEVVTVVVPESAAKAAPVSKDTSGHLRAALEKQTSVQ